MYSKTTKMNLNNYLKKLPVLSVLIFTLALAFFSDNRVIKIVERIVLKAHAKRDDMKTHFLIGPVLLPAFFTSRSLLLH